ncbi:hypothetical protein LQD23_21235 [Chromobacterium violaceum]|uniref:hypothetical protein n=1 Tax=Chromobacterium violaceum TaxID=536 RepID=UPI001E573D8F|nr:hypothetical protein [Chromobacterium violaceum]MCD0494802.1 hypothetical protein [Chromobacterium violaceum]
MTQHETPHLGKSSGRPMRIKSTLPTALIALIIGLIGVIAMNQQDGKHPHKVFNDLLGKEKTIENFDYFLDDRMNKKKLTAIDRKNLERFIDENLNILSESTSLDDIDHKNPNIQVELFTPKLPSTPITWGSLTYTYIIAQPNQSSRGSYGDFTSYITRKDEASPWKFASMAMGTGYKTLVQTNFDLATFDKLNLKFSEKFLLADLASQQRQLDFTPTADYKKFVESDGNGANYAFYKFTTTRNSIPLTIIFGVEKDQYNEQETHPKNWLFIYMKRDN